VLGLFGLALLIGGFRLVSLGGSWYYLIAGAALGVAGILIARGRMSGAWLYGAAFLGTLVWTIWEIGLDFWGYVPRVALLLILAIILALLLPRLYAGPSRGVARAIAGVLAAAFLVAVALAFAPHHTFRSEAAAPQAAPLASNPSPADGSFVQPADAPADGDWAAYGRSNAATRYSPLAQIDRGNVAKLERAWVYRTGDMPVEGMTRWAAETTPLKIGDRLYLCTAMNRLVGLDAATGKELWRYDPKVSTDWIPYSASCRGVAYYEAPELAENAACKRRVIEGTLDARLIAVDARDGRP
jgi:quinoprotein glucose dehydrogenase